MIFGGIWVHTVAEWMFGCTLSFCLLSKKVQRGAVTSHDLIRNVFFVAKQPTGVNNNTQMSSLHEWPWDVCFQVC